ncbi:hypothetical protein KAJ27_06375 [bacterium]|nr:hypothetical protein [bacterium]
MKHFFLQKPFIWNVLILIVSFALFFSAIDHRIHMTTDREAYTKSKLIIVEFLSLILLIIMHLINFCIMGYLILKEKWKLLIFSIFVMVSSFVFIVLAFQIDAPTLIYLTRR